MKFSYDSDQLDRCVQYVLEKKKKHSLVTENKFYTYEYIKEKIFDIAKTLCRSSKHDWVTTLGILVLKRPFYDDEYIIEFFVDPSVEDHLPFDQRKIIFV